MKKLIVTADDLGLHRGMTIGAIEAHRRGIVTACSVSACGRELDHAIDALAEVEALETGAHLTLVEERPVLDPAEIPSLVRSDGVFHHDYREFGARLLAGRIDLGEVKRELRAQLELLAGKGLALRHVNSHQHLHLIPRLFAIVRELAEEMNIGYVRIVNEAAGSSKLSRRVSLAGLGILGRRASVRPLRSNDWSIGVHGAGHLTAAAIIGLLALEPGVTELVTHPGLGNSDLSRSYDWHYDWDGETAALCDPTVGATIEMLEISLVRPSDV